MPRSKMHPIGWPLSVSNTTDRHGPHSVHCCQLQTGREPTAACVVYRYISTQVVGDSWQRAGWEGVSSLVNLTAEEAVVQDAGRRSMQH